MPVLTCVCYIVIMVIQRGIVSKIEESRVWVMALSEKNEESGCTDGGCGSGCSCNVTGQVFRAVNARGLPLEKGDKVEVRAEASALGWGVFLVLVLPVILALGFWFGIPLLTKSGPSAWMALCGAGAGLLLGLLSGRKERNMPVIETLL